MPECDGHPASHPASHVAVAITLKAQASSLIIRIYSPHRPRKYSKTHNGNRKTTDREEIDEI